MHVATPPRPMPQATHGTLWLSVCAALSLCCVSSHAAAQAAEEAPVEEAPTAPSEEAPTDTAPTERAPTEQAPTEQAPAEDAPAEDAPADAAPTEAATTEAATTGGAPAEAPPSEAAPSEAAAADGAPADAPRASEALSAPVQEPVPSWQRERSAEEREILRVRAAERAARGPSHAHGPSRTRAPTVPDTPPERWWRMPREMTRRPLTIPQGVLRVDSTTGVSSVGPMTRANGGLQLSVGLTDDLEIGSTPIGITFLPNLSFHDPSFYVRGRVLRGELQIALRGDVWIPAGQLEAQINGRVELAWTPEPWFRLDAAAEYGLQFGSPVHQRIALPVRAMFQAGPNAFALGTGLTVWNDGDDVDVPLFGSYTIVWQGYQGPAGEATLRGGSLDVTGYGAGGWFFGGQMTWYAYF